MESTKKKAIGIDLGTTYSCVAVYENNRVTIIPNKLGFPITPSIVAFTSEGKAVGETARIQMSKDPLNTIYDAKRMIGMQFSSEVV
jgi:molecular chaperone DnaK (HSP70)